MPQLRVVRQLSARRRIGRRGDFKLRIHDKRTGSREAGWVNTGRRSESLTGHCRQGIPELRAYGVDTVQSAQSQRLGPEGGISG